MCEAFNKYFSLLSYWQKSPQSSRRSSCSKDEPLLPPCSSSSLSKKRPSLSDIFDDGSADAARRMPTPDLLPPPVTQVYRAETERARREPAAVVDKGELLLGSIIRTSERNRRLQLEEEKVRRCLRATPSPPPNAPSPVQPEINLGPSVAEVERRLERECRIRPAASIPKPQRIRSVSERQVLEPLDMSFDGEVEDIRRGGVRARSGKAVRRLDPASPPADGSEEDEEEEEEEDADSTAHQNGHQNGAVPSPSEMAHFRKSFDSAASMVFHRRTGLPLTSSPAPLRRSALASEKFDFDSSISTPHDIKRALFREGGKEEEEPEADVENRSPIRRVLRSRRRRVRTSGSSTCSGTSLADNANGHRGLSASAPATVASSNLLGSFEESVLNGRLEPVSTVEGFTAEIGASGSFHPRHRTLPVTVFFYTLCGGDASNVSSPYLGHINLGRKGYRVPERGTLQVTLFNPLGTVVKMFVVRYDLSDMPPNSQTFLRQRTLYMPSGERSFCRISFLHIPRDERLGEK